MPPVVSPSETQRVEAAVRQARAAELQGRLCELAAHTHAAMAELSTLAAELDDIEGWCGDGFRSFAHWLTLNADFAPRTGHELLRVGRALQTLPRTRAAFAAGTLSFDSVRELTQVATTDDEAVWLGIAASASGAQLSRICRAGRRALDLDTREHADSQLRRRGLWTHFDEDGMLHLRAQLLPEDGALVTAAIEATVRAAAAERTVHAHDPPEREDVPDPADEPWAARRADALVAVCRHALATDAGSLVADPAALPMLVHVDAGALTGTDSHGRRYIDGGPVLATSTIRRLGCDASVITLTERDGLPINVGRRRRIVPTPLRRAIQSRDRTCRFPGCPIPAQRTQAHHLEHWFDLGPTERQNLASLCSFHHGRHHDGAYRIRGHPDAELIFETPDGRPIVCRLASVDPAVPRTEALRGAVRNGDALQVDAATACTTDPSARMDLGYVVSVVLDGVERAHRLAGSE